MKLYKYINLNSKYGKENATAILERNEIYAADYRELNDPFEFSFYRTRPNQNGASPTATRLVNAIMKFSKGVISLSATNSDLLLWSHYAAGHTGVCVEFEMEKDHLLKTATKINYQENMPEIDDNDPDNFVFTKCIDWKYEAEFRVVKDKGAKKYHKIKPSCITGVYFGVRAIVKTHGWILEACQERNIPCFEAFRIARKYRVEFRQLDKIDDFASFKKYQAAKKLVADIVSGRRQSKIDRKNFPKKK